MKHTRYTNLNDKDKVVIEITLKQSGQLLEDYWITLNPRELQGIETDNDFVDFLVSQLHID